MTIFVTCFFNLVVRNILETEFLRLLKAKKDLKIVLLVPEKKSKFFEKEYGGPNVLIEEVPRRPISRINLLFHLLSWNLLKTRSKKIHKIVQLGKDHNYFKYLLTFFVSWLGGFSLIRRCFRWLDYVLVPGGGYARLFEKYRPDVVFATDIQDLRVQELSDTYLIREARRRGIKSVAMSRSWDSMTTKGLLRTLPDVLVVQNEGIKRQAVQYHGASPDQITVVGFPHYDSYVAGQRTSRQDFFRKIGLDPNKKLIFLTAPSDVWTGDTSFAQYLFGIVASLGEQSLVRFPIFGDLQIGGFVPPRNMIFDRPGNSAKLEDSLLVKSDDAHLADSIYHSDIVVTGPSSIILDAAVLDKPTILIGFDGKETKPLWQSLRRYYQYEHQSVIIEKGKIMIAGNENELRSLIKYYLANPNLGREDRRIVSEVACFRLDGLAGERLADLILKNL